MGFDFFSRDVSSMIFVLGSSFLDEDVRFSLTVFHEKILFQFL